jgi:hypothetical protein
MGSLIKYSRPQKVNANVERLARRRGGRRKRRLPLILLIVLGVIAGIAIGEFVTGHLSLGDIERAVEESAG